MTVAKSWAIAGGLFVMAWTGAAAAQVMAPAPDSLQVGDWAITPTVDLRLRGEYWHDLDGQNDGVAEERVRLGLDVERGPLEARVVIQDARSFGLGSPAPIASPGFLAVTSAYEGWIEAHTDGVRPSFVRAGRQPVTWGEGRLLGEADWSPTGRTLDAVRGRLVVRDASFELLATALESPETGTALDAYGELLGARAEWSFDPLFALEAYALVRIAQQTPAFMPVAKGETYTGALRLHGDSRGWTWGAEGAYQLGRVRDLDADRAAWAAAGHVAYLFEGAMWRPAVQVGVSYASGDSGGATYRQFDPLLPDVHRWHGAMDLFAWSNEEEANGRVTVVPITDTLASVAYRYVRLAQAGGPWVTAYLTPVGVAPRNTDASLGHEIDAVFRWSPWEPLRLEAGYSILFLGDGARAILGSSGVGAVPRPPITLSSQTLAQFAYAQATLRLP